MIGRLLVFGLLGVVGVWSVGASRSGSGARDLSPSRTPAEAVAAYERYLEDERHAAERAERRRRYDAGEMSPAEARQFEAEMEAERQAAEAERQRQIVIARSVRGTRVSGGGPSSGK